jgi:phospholipase C
VPAVIVSPWVAEGAVFNQEHRHTSMIATLREQWNLGEPFTGRDAAARTFRARLHPGPALGPKSWPVPNPRPVPSFVMDATALGQVLSQVGKTFLDGLRQHAAENNVNLEGLPGDPTAEWSGRAVTDRLVELIMPLSCSGFGGSGVHIGRG